jgi:hypothetical protein
MRLRRLSRYLSRSLARRLPHAAVTACLLTAGAASAQQQTASGPSADAGARYFTATEPNVPEKAEKVLYALRVTQAPPVIDGVLDDAIWMSADSTGNLLQQDPDNMQPMTERTIVRVLYDARNIYVGVRLLDSDAEAIRSGLGRRDRPPPSDRFTIGFDTQHDHLTGYAFTTNPSGVQQEGAYFDDTSMDMEYNAVWEVEARMDANGWTAEYRIPFSQMRFQAPPSGGAVWGLEMLRSVQRKNENGRWVGRPRGTNGEVSRWGHLVFEGGLETPRRVEALPFVLTSGNAPADADFSDDYDAGLDLRMGLGRSSTLAATFNPDFGQVEADPAVLNLGVFETFFPEKRPFFLSDGNIFVPSYGLFQLFHSRRIGARPGYLRPFQQGDVVLDRPEQTTILGATKVTGKSSGYTYGALTALTAEEHALVQAGGADGLGVARIDRTIEPMTSYSAARLQRDLGRGSNVSVLGTSVLREGAPDAFAGAFEYRIRWDRNRWQWNGQWAGTNAPRVARSTEQVSGFGGVSNLTFNVKNWNANAHVHYFSDNFRVADLGFFRTRTGEQQLSAGGGYSDPDPGRFLRSWNIGGNFGRSRVHALTVGEWINVFGGLQLLNFWGVFGGIGYGPAVHDDLDTRGGPPILRPETHWANLSLNSDPRRRWNWFVNWFGNDNTSAGHDWGIDQGLDLRPSPRVQLALSAGYNTGLNRMQWVTNQDVTGDGATDYVYSTLESDVVNITLRGSAAVNRDLTLEAFLQPFVAVGDYTDFKRLAAPNTHDFTPIDGSRIEDPDFNSKSLRGTFVLRWEYIRGSTIFLAWNLTGSDEQRPGLFQPMRDIRGVFGAPIDNRVMLKANYWFSL